MRRLAFLSSLLLALPLHAAITGTLINIDGQPVASAKVSLFALETAEAQTARLFSATERVPIASAPSDAKGKFSLESPKDAVVTLSVNAAGYAPYSTAVERDENRGAILLTAAAMKQARILAAGKGVSGAKIAMTGAAEFITTTDAEGRYSVPDPSKWAARLYVSHPDYAIVNESARGYDARKLAEDRTLEAGVALSGRVFGADGKSPVAGAVISVDDLPAGKSGDDGTFTIAHAPRKWQAVQARSGALAAERARSEAAITIRMARMATISGTVRETKTQAPLAGVDVRVRPSRRFDFAASAGGAITDAKGTYSVSVPPGSYEIVMTRPGYTFINTSVTASPNARITKNVVAIQLARVSGSVTDENKAPLGATRLEAGRIGSESGMRMYRFANVEQIAFTAPDGSFAMRVEPDADVQIEAKKRGYPEARSATMRFAQGERKSGVLLTIPLGIQLTGHVLDKNGKPVSAVAVAAYELRTGGAPFTRRTVRFGERADDENSVHTAADGSFTMRLKAGTYDLGFKREGYASKTVTARQVNASMEPVDITLEEGVQLNGRVTRGGAGVEGVTINIFSQDSEGHAETAADGSFHIADLTPGQVMVNVYKPDEFIQDFRPVKVPGEDLIIDLPAGGTITGRVVEKDSKTPVTTFDAGFSNARGGGGMMFMGPPLLKHFTTDDGTFVLPNVPPGVTTLTVSAPGFSQARVPNLTVENNKTIADVEVQMERGVKVSGHVTGSNGDALSGVSVTSRPAGPRRGPAFTFTPTVTDANGEYTIENVESGEQTFTFELSGYLTTDKTARLSGGEARVDAQMSTGMKLTGFVVNEAGAPVADAGVMAQTAAETGGYRSTRTDGNGQFQMEGLAPGRYTFRASKAGYASGILKDFDISGGAPVRIALQPGGTITGMITGVTAEELTRAGVTASSTTGGNAGGVVDPSGSFRIEGAPSGTVRVMAFVQAAGGFSGRNSPAKSVQLEPGGTAHVDIEFASGSVRGHVTRDGQPASQAMVLFFPQRGAASTQARVTTDGNGYYEANGLEDATYDVQVVDMQRSTPYMTTYTVSGSSTFNIDIKSATLRGRVVDATTGKPIEQAFINLRMAGEGNTRMPLRITPTSTDSSGAFILDGVSPGLYSVGAEKEGYGTKAVDVTVAESGGDVEIKLAPNAGVSLRVVDGRDGRLLSAFVRVTDMANKLVYDYPFRLGASAETMNLPLEPGTYRMTVIAQGYATKNTTITSPSTQTIAMTPGGTIAIKSAGSAMRRARLLTAEGREYVRGYGWMPVFNIDPSPGTTTLENVEPGTYTLQIMDGDAVLASTQVTVVEGQVTQVGI